MIPATKSPLFSRWFARDAERRLASAFDAVLMTGLPELRRLTKEGPVLVVSNHTAWWDPLVVLYLCERVLGVDAYAMMDAKNLRKMPFFGRVGAFGVDLEDPNDGARAIRYAAKLLDRPGRLVWIFAQGEERPMTQRPLGFRGGSAEIARVAKSCAIVPAALRYEHGGTPRPRVLAAFGAALTRNRDTTRGRLEQETAVTAALDTIDAALVSKDLSSFEVMLETPPSRLFAMLSRLLALLTR